MFDPYYETKVNPRWGSLPIGTVLGGLLIFLGLLSFTFSISDLTAGVAPKMGSAWQENSIWPTIGKGIWVGAVMIGTGIIGVISKHERTQVSLYVFNGLCWVTAVLSLYQVMSSILHIEPYMTTNLSDSANRSLQQNLEVSMNSLLVATGSLAFIVSVAAGLLSCIAGNCCVNRRNLLTTLVQNPENKGYRPIPAFAPVHQQDFIYPPAVVNQNRPTVIPQPSAHYIKPAYSYYIGQRPIAR